MLQLLEGTLADLYDRVQAYLPDVLTALLLVLVGLLIAFLLRALTTRLLHGIATTLASRTYGGSLEESRSLRVMPVVAGAIAFWLTFFVFLSAAIEYLEFDIFAGVLAQFTRYLPNVFLASLLVLVGVAMGSFVRQAIRSAIRAAGVGGADLIGRLAQASIVLVACVVAADQIGIDSTFLMLIIGIAIGTTLGGMALAFGIGSGPVVSNVIASYYVRRMYRAGLNVRIGSIEGRVVEILPTTVALETAAGRVQVPCRKFLDDVSLLVRDS
jgi:small-conductance mechanosensitive channel